MRPLRRNELVAFVLTATFLVFAPALGGGFYSDDHTLIEQDPRVADPSRWGDLLASPLWSFDVDDASSDPAYARIHRPMTKVAFLIGRVIGAGAPIGYHVVALAMHLVVVGLVFRFLERRGLTTSAAALGAMVFALHPSRVESVAWISGLSDTTMTVFVLLAAESAAGSGGARRTIGTMAFGFLGVASKEPAILLAPALVALECAPRGRSVALRTSALALAGGAAALALAAFVTRGAAPVMLVPAAARPFAGLGAAVVRTFVALPITFDPYPFGFDARGARTLPRLEIAVGIAAAAVALGIGALALRRTLVRPFAYAIGLFLLGVAPVLGFEGRATSELFVDRFLYAPLLGLAWIVALAFDRIPASRRRIAGLLAFALVLGVSLPTSRAVATFADEGAWIARERSLHPLDAHWCMTDRIRRITPDDPQFVAAIDACLPLARRADDRDFALNLVLLRVAAHVRGAPDRELPETRSIRDAYRAFVDTGVLDVRIDGRDYRAEVARSRLHEALRQTGLIHVPLAALEIRLREFDSASRWAERAVGITPRLPDAWMTWLTALARGGRFADARAVLPRARAAFPHDPTLTVGFEQALGRAEEAAASSLDPLAKAIAVATALGDHAGVLHALGSRCASPGRLEVAMLCARESLAVQDRDAALATLAARARIAPTESAQIERIRAQIASAPH